MSWFVKKIRLTRKDSIIKSRYRRNREFPSGDLIFVMATPQDIDPGNNDYLIKVGGLSSPYSGSQLVKCTLSITHPDMSEIYFSVFDPGFTAESNLIANGDLAGANVTDAIFYNQNITLHPAITSGSSPYTGTWKDNSGSYIFDTAFNGVATNGNWAINIFNFGVTVGSVTGLSLEFAY